MAEDRLPGEFHPELLSRRGEAVAWGTALLVWSAWLIVRLRGLPVIAAVPLLAVVLLLAALSISLGNWMDRQTVLRLEPDGIEYQNGLRHARLDWNDIRQVQVFPSNWGKKVQVVGGNAHFEFRTLGEVKVQGETKGRMGFTEGEWILSKILDAAHLRRIEHPGPGYYYARE
ncbi:MAG TPA: hypothetical protein VF498_02555 [Anaerolineales bacterium]